MSENMKKPEWFELADSDEPSAQVAKVNKKLPIAAILITGAVIATGAFFASASENNASAEGVTQVTSPSSAAAGATPDASASSTPSASNGVTTPGIQDPTQGGVPAPGANRGDGDGDRGHEWGERREHDGDRDGDHDGREGHEERD